MRLLKNILLAVLILIVVIPMVVTIAMQYPSVQTAICKEAMGGLTGKINGQVDVGNVYYAPLNSLVVENVVVTGAEGDTVLSCGKVSLKVQVLSLLMKEVKVRKIGLYGGTVVLRNISENETNISRLLAPLSALEKKEKKEKKELCIRMDRLVVDNL
ncbi:MAG: hypothetical protein HUJ93_06960, partial [Bacteroidales bacterium]|nr:hypothetical protein [Bacteroidales bacterium]